MREAHRRGVEGESPSVGRFAAASSAPSVGPVLITIPPPAALPLTLTGGAASRLADPMHLVLLAVLALAVAGYLLYRRVRSKHTERSTDSTDDER